MKLPSDPLKGESNVTKMSGEKIGGLFNPLKNSVWFSLVQFGIKQKK